MMNDKKRITVGRSFSSLLGTGTCPININLHIDLDSTLGVALLPHMMHICLIMADVYVVNSVNIVSLIQDTQR